MKITLYLTFIGYLIASSFFTLKGNLFFQPKNRIFGCADEEVMNENRENRVLRSDFELPDFPIYPPDDPLPPFDPVPTINVPYYGDRDYINQFFYYSYDNYVSNTIGEGNCGISSISLLLAYYDSFWHDGFIPTQYEMPAYLVDENDTSYFSPGILDNYYFNYSANNLSEEQKDNEVLNFVENQIDLQDTSFLGLLLYYSSVAGALKIDDGQEMTLFSHNETIALLNKYIEENTLLQNSVQLVHDSCYSNDQTLLQDLRNDVIQIVQTGIPVIVGGYRNDISEIGHICIAYDYDETNDILYGHMGWANPYNGNHQVDLSNNYYNLNSYFQYGITDYYYLSLDNSFAHSHCNNYLYEGYSSRFCSCELTSHNHHYFYEEHNSSIQYRRCMCQILSEQDNHVFGESYFVGLTEYARCIKCNYLANLNDGPILGV